MARLKSFLALIVLILAILIVLVFYFRNSTVVTVDLIFLQIEGFGLGFWLLSCLVVGAAIGAVLSWPSVLLLKVSRNANSRKLKLAEKKLERINSSPTAGA